MNPPNGIGSDAAAKLRDGTTTKLDLKGKKSGDAGVAVLAKVLPECTALTKLDLDKNEISAAGAATRPAARQPFAL